MGRARRRDLSVFFILSLFLLAPQLAQLPLYTISWHNYAQNKTTHMQTDIHEQRIMTVHSRPYSSSVTARDAHVHGWSVSVPLTLMIVLQITMRQALIPQRSTTEMLCITVATLLRSVVDMLWCCCHSSWQCSNC
jgi:hypothetical protein